ncbi:MAG: SH3 domain-containing protein [Anaerolineales bacterium]|nr:SH3 domain-containing protein [Anaerolineales bacterium]
MITHSKQIETKVKPGRLHWPRIIAMSLMALALMALLSGCAANTANLQTLAPASTAGIPTALGTAIQPLSAYAAPIPTATPTPPPPGKKQFATVATQGTRVNLRSGPGTNFDIITKANPGAAFEYVGTNNG